MEAQGQQHQAGAGAASGEPWQNPILNPALPEWFSTGTDVGPEVGEWSWGMESLECSPGYGCEGPRGTSGTRSTGMCWDEGMRSSG